MRELHIHIGESVAIGAGKKAVGAVSVNSWNARRVTFKLVPVCHGWKIAPGINFAFAAVINGIKVAARIAADSQRVYQSSQIGVRPRLMCSL